MLLVKLRVREDYKFDDLVGSIEDDPILITQSLAFQIHLMFDAV